MRYSASPQDFVSLAVAGTSNESDTVPAADRAFARIAGERRGVYGLFHGLEVARVGGGFDPSMGHVARAAYTRAGASVAYGFAMSQDSRLLRQAWQLTGSGHRRRHARRGRPAGGPALCVSARHWR